MVTDELLFFWFSVITNVLNDGLHILLMMACASLKYYLMDGSPYVFGCIS